MDDCSPPLIDSNNSKTNPQPCVLIILPCHGICKSPQDWIGIYPGEEKLLFSHFQAALDKYLQSKLLNSESKFIISGGYTRKEYLETSESRSLFNNLPLKLQSDPHILLEEFARDSLENLMFSFLLYSHHVTTTTLKKHKIPNFWIHTLNICTNPLSKNSQSTSKLPEKYPLPGSLFFPEKTFVFGWEFKRDRFVQIAQSLSIPEFTEFHYIGVNNPVNVPLHPESQRVAMFKSHPDGNVPALQSLRKQRDPLSHGIPVIIEPECEPPDSHSDSST